MVQSKKEFSSALQYFFENRSTELCGDEDGVLFSVVFRERGEKNITAIMENYFCITEGGILLFGSFSF